MATDYARALGSRLRREHPSFRRPDFFRGRSIHGLEIHDVVWLRHDDPELVAREPGATRRSLPNPPTRSSSSWD